MRLLFWRKRKKPPYTGPNPGSPLYWYPAWTFYATGHPEQARAELRQVIAALLAYTRSDASWQDIFDGARKTVQPILDREAAAEFVGPEILDKVLR